MFRALRIAVLILAIVATLGVSVASASHVDSSPGGCNLCFVAHTVAFETPAAHLIFAPEILGAAPPADSGPDYLAHGSKPSFSRGPPSLV